MDGTRYQRPISGWVHAGRAAWSSSASGVLRWVWDNMVSSSLTTEGGRAFMSNPTSGIGQDQMRVSLTLNGQLELRARPASTQ